MWLLGGGALRDQPAARGGLAAVALLFSLLLAVRDSDVLTALNFAVAAVFGVRALSPGRLRAEAPVWDHGRAMAGLAAGAVFDGPEVVNQALLRGRAAGLGPVLRGLALSVPVIVVFASLLSNADSVFDARLSTALQSIFRLEGLSVAAVIGVSTVVLAGVGAQVLRAPREQVRSSTGAGPRFGLRLGFSEALTVLVCLELLFAAFVVVQARYLFGDPARLASLGLTYADYARRGFFELQAVTVLTLTLVLALGRLTGRTGRAQEAAFNLACTVLVVLVFAIVASAHRRLGLYEAAYGYTEQRVYSHAFIFLMAAVLALRVLTFWWRPGAFVPGAIGLATLALGLLNLLEPGRVHRAPQRPPGPPDVAYLATLSDDAVPALYEGASRRPDDPFFVELVSTLAHRPRDPSWPALHLSRLRARQLLGEYP